MDTDKVGQGIGVGSFVLGLADTAFSTVRQLDWIKNKLPEPARPMISLYAAIALMAIGIAVFWKYRSKPPSLRPPNPEPPSRQGPPNFTAIKVIGDKNTFINTTITPPAQRISPPREILTTHGSQSPIAGRDVHQHFHPERSKPTRKLTLLFDPNDPECTRREGTIPREYRVKVINATGAPVRGAHVKIEGSVPNLQNFSGAQLRVRHAAEYHSTVDLADDTQDYFNLMEYNPQSPRPEIYICHTTRTLPHLVPLENYEFRLKAYSAEVTSDELLVKFEQLFANDSRLTILSLGSSPTPKSDNAPFGVTPSSRTEERCQEAEFMDVLNFSDGTWQETSARSAHQQKRLVRYASAPADGCFAIESSGNEHKLLRTILPNDRLRASRKIRFWAMLPSQEEKIYFLVQTEKDGKLNHQDTWLECVPGKSSLKPIRAENTNNEYRIHVEGGPAAFAFTEYCIDLAYQISRIETLREQGWVYSGLCAIQVRFTGKMCISGFTGYGAAVYSS
jgi:hypothetical protein